jgi:hypothetical protein
MKLYDTRNADFVMDAQEDVGIQFEDAMGNKAVTVVRRGPPRQVKLKITMYGIVGGVHYYGDLLVDGPVLMYTEVNKGDMFRSVGRMRSLPDNFDLGTERIHGLQVSLSRPVETHMINGLRPRYRDFKPGDFTCTFDSEEQVIEHAVDFFKSGVFVGDWVLVHNMTEVEIARLIKE